MNLQKCYKELRHTKSLQKTLFSKNPRKNVRKSYEETLLADL